VCALRERFPYVRIQAAADTNAAGWHDGAMAFRDDRDALRARAEALESEIADVERQFERATDALRRQEEKDTRDESELASLRDEVMSLRRQLGVQQSKREKSGQKAARRGEPAARRAGVNPASMQKNAGRRTGVGLALLVLLGGLSYILGGGRSKEASSASVSVPTVVATPEPAELPKPLSPPDSTSPPVSPLDVVRLGAEVTSVEGLDLAPGSGCVIEATMTGVQDIESVRVICDGLLYDSVMMETGAAITTHEARASATSTDEGAVYLLKYSDIGMRTGLRPQLWLDSWEGGAEVWSANQHPFRVRLRILDQSTPRPGVAADGPGRQSGRALRRNAALTSSTGPAPEVPESGCDMYARPYVSNGRLDCRVLISCGGELLYGAHDTGYNACTFADGAIMGANDEGNTAANSDPVMRFDRAAQTLTLEDDSAQGHWRLDFALAPDPRCTLRGEWSGAVTNSMATLEGLHMSVDDELVLTRPMADSAALTAAADDTERVVVDCDSGQVALVDRDGTRWEGTFGHGYGTILGHVRGGQPETFWFRRE